MSPTAAPSHSPAAEPPVLLLGSHHRALTLETDAPLGGFEQERLELREGFLNQVRVKALGRQAKERRRDGLGQSMDR